MPRTTLDIERSVLRAVKERAREEHKSLGAIVSEIVGAALAERPSGRRRRPFEWRTARMGPALVDLEDKTAVTHAAMGGRAAHRG
jgi:hypothetical protein